MAAGLTFELVLAVPAYRRLPLLDRIRNLLPVNVSRCPTSSPAALPSRSAFVASHDPCSVWVASAGSAPMTASPAPSIESESAEVRRSIAFSYNVAVCIRPALPKNHRPDYNTLCRPFLGGGCRG